MAVSALGREDPELVDRKTAASLLKVDTQTVDRLVQNGYLSYTCDGERGHLFRVSEVARLAEARSAKEVDLSDILTIALQARATARDNEAKLRQLFTLFGADYRHLPRDEDEVLRTYTKARDTIKVEVLDVEALLDWTQFFLSVDEDYFALVARLTSDPEPWRVYVDFAQRIWDKMPVREFGFDKEKEVAYAFLNVGRRHLRNTAYFYVRKHEGRREAGIKFPGARNDPDQRIVDLITISPGR